METTNGIKDNFEVVEPVDERKQRRISERKERKKKKVKKFCKIVEWTVLALCFVAALCLISFSYGCRLVGKEADAKLFVEKERLNNVVKESVTLIDAIELSHKEEIDNLNYFKESYIKLAAIYQVPPEYLRDYNTMLACIQTREIYLMSTNNQTIASLIDSYETKLAENEDYSNKRKICLITDSDLPMSESDILKLDLRKNSLITAKEIDEFLEGTNLEGLGASFKAAEKEFNVNAIFLTSLAILESGWGESQIAIDKNNLFGWKAYDSNPYKHAMTFESKEECIHIVAEGIKQNYLSSDGEHYNGFTLPEVNIKYCTSDKWAKKVANLMKSIDNYFK